MTATTMRPTTSDAASSYDLRILVAWRRASILHLLDLKRAGYSPTRTELVVDRRSDRILAEPARSKRVRRVQ